MSMRSVTRDFDGIICIPVSEACRRLRKKQGTLAQWRRDGCPGLESEALIVFRTPNDPRVKTWCEEDQINRILEAMTESREAFTYPDGVYLTYKGAWRRHRMPRTTLRRQANAGRVAIRKRAYVSGGKGRGKSEETLYREKDIVEYQRAQTKKWDGVSTNGDGESLSLTAASCESGISRQQLWKYIKREELSAELRDPPPGQRGRGRSMFAIDRQQFRDFCTRLRIENTQRVPPGWESAYQRSQRLGLTLEQRMKLARQLREGRTNGSLNPVRIRRAAPPHRRVWYYDPGEVDTLLGQPSRQATEEPLEQAARSEVDHASSRTVNTIVDPCCPQSDTQSVSAILDYVDAGVMIGVDSVNKSTQNGEAQQRLDQPDIWMAKLIEILEKLDRNHVDTREILGRIYVDVREVPQQTAELVQQQITETRAATESPTDARGRWLYEQRQIRKSFRAIVYELGLIAERRGWEPLNSEPAASTALRIWCEKHGRDYPRA